MRKGIAGSEVTLSVDETYYKGMLDVLPERVIRFRLPDLTILYCNAAWSRSHHLTPAEAIGRTMDELLSPAARADLELQLVQLSPENTLARDHTARPAPNAPGRWLEWVDQYLPSADGAEVLAVGHDVTERHIAELFLADSEARFRAARRQLCRCRLALLHRAVPTLRLPEPVDREDPRLPGGDLSRGLRSTARDPRSPRQGAHPRSLDRP